MATKQQPPKKKASNFVRLGLFWAILIFAVLSAIAIFSPHDNLKEVGIDNVLKRANAGEIKKIEVQGNDLKITPKDEDKPTEKAFKEAGSSLYEQGLQQGKTDLKVSPPSEAGNTLWNGDYYRSSTPYCCVLYVHDAPSAGAEQPSNGLW